MYILDMRPYLNASRAHPLLLGALACVLTSALGLLATGGAVFSSANTSTASQFRAMHALFLADAPPPTHPATLCLVDTGVSINRGTATAVVTREAVAGGSPSDNVGHGTMLAQSVAAPAGFGFTGLWPRVRIISERVTDESGTVWSDMVVEAINRCVALGAAVINISLTATSLGDQGPAFAAAIAAATAHNVVMVAAAGNDSSGTVQYPAALPGVLAVGATPAKGCAPSARGSQVALTAPGCFLDISASDGSPESGTGTSFSSVYVATVATALRAYSGADASTIIHDLEATTTGGAVNAAAAFALAGLEAMTATPTASSSTHPTSSQSSTSTGTTVLFPSARGRVRATWTAGGVRVRSTLPHGLRLLVRSHGLTARGGANLLLPVARVRSIQVAFVAADGQHSRWTRITVR